MIGFGDSRFGSAPGSGGGNATVPGGTVPADPQDFVDAAVFLGEGEYSIWIGEGFPFSAISLTNLDRLVFLPTTVAGPRTYNFEFATGGMWMCPDLASLAGRLNLTGGSVATPGFTALTSPFTGHLDLNNNDIVTPGLGAGWTAFAGILNLSYNSIVTPGFGGLTSLAGTLNLSGNSIVTPGFGGLTSLAGTLDLSGNSIVTPGFSGLTSLAGTLNLRGNEIATSGFSGLTSLAGTLELGANSPTVAINHASLATLSGALSFSDSPNATSANFSGLTTLSGTLDFSNCSSLETLTGFASISNLSGSLILNGANLDQAGVDDLITKLASSITVGGGFLDLTNLGGVPDVSISPDLAALEALITVSYMTP